MVSQEIKLPEEWHLLVSGERGKSQQCWDLVIAVLQQIDPIKESYPVEHLNQIIYAPDTLKFPEKIFMDLCAYSYAHRGAMFWLLLASNIKTRDPKYVGHHTLPLLMKCAYEDVVGDNGENVQDIFDSADHIDIEIVEAMKQVLDDAHLAMLTSE